VWAACGFRDASRARDSGPVVVDLGAVKDWVRTWVDPPGAIETVRERPWATVLRVPLKVGVVWFKASGAMQAFEPRLTADLYRRWPDRVVEVLAHDAGLGWLLLADAGSPVGAFGNPPEAWLAMLPLYAELQLAEAGHVEEHIAGGVPDLRPEVLPDRFEELMRSQLPLDPEETLALARFAERFTQLCGELAASQVPATIQHDDLHHANLYARDDRLRVLDWGDASIAHPFASLVVTFRFLEQRTGLAPGDPWFTRLRDAYLEPWGGAGLQADFELALRVGGFARAIASLQTRSTLARDELADFDRDFATVLRRAMAR